MLITLAILVITGVFIVWFTRRFVGLPVRRLIEGTRAISEMNLDRPITEHSSVELEELARSFEVMRLRLRESVDEVNTFTRSLESKVAERTAMLKTAQRRLMQSDRLASLGQLSATVAHEINNPVSGVLNLGMLMQRILTDDGVPPDRIEEFRRYLAQIVTETGRVGRIVQDLLAFSRRSKPQRATANLNTIIASTINLIDHKLMLMKIRVELALDPALPPVRCDASLIQQVMLNLIINGAEAAQGRNPGTVRVDTRVNPGGERRGDSRHRQRRRDPAGASREDFRPLLHDQGGGKGHGSRAGGRVRDRRGAQRRDRRRQHPRRGNDLHHPAPLHRDPRRGPRDDRGVEWCAMNVIYIVSLGPIDEEIVTAAEQAVWRVFGTETRRLVLGDGVGYAFDAAREQYNSVLILRDVHRNAPGDAMKVLALTDRDLFIPMLSFVFGQAQLGGTVAIVSVARLRQEFYGLPANPALTLARTVKETIHEVGHTFGLIHCHDPSCPMSLANSVVHADRKGEHLCAACTATLSTSLMATSKSS